MAAGERAAEPGGPWTPANTFRICFLVQELTKFSWSLAPLNGLNTPSITAPHLASCDNLLNVGQLEDGDMETGVSGRLKVWGGDCGVACDRSPAVKAIREDVAHVQRKACAQRSSGYAQESLPYLVTVFFTIHIQREEVSAERVPVQLHSRPE
ncbi:hypothetical protein ARMGADRAFT_1040171 [Armillaria gallica]|uniref:Uncharacterized protein n=1 Tax=Armillaria gallica TaxID=47427 RepID=A0A2H3CPE9_ARMGA|nr:hypothetical protein ARMGADRAFT_1040171 [Armillaria gallica]